MSKLFLLMFVFGLATTANALTPEEAKAKQAYALGVQAYIWGLFDNVWSFAGSDDEDINLFNFQYQVVYLFPNIEDWFFISNWTAEADWEAPSGEKWTIPVGGGFGKQFKIGKHQFQAYGQLGYNVVKPDDDAATWRGIGVVVWVF